MVEIIRMLAANIRRQFFFVITTTTSTRCLVQNFQLICCSQGVNATSQSGGVHKHFFDRDCSSENKFQLPKKIECPKIQTQKIE